MYLFIYLLACTNNNNNNSTSTSTRSPRTKRVKPQPNYNWSFLALVMILPPLIMSLRAWLRALWPAWPAWPPWAPEPLAAPPEPLAAPCRFFTPNPCLRRRFFEVAITLWWHATVSGSEIKEIFWVCWKPFLIFSGLKACVNAGTRTLNSCIWFIFAPATLKLWESSSFWYFCFSTTYGTSSSGCSTCVQWGGGRKLHTSILFSIIIFMNLALKRWLLWAAGDSFGCYPVSYFPSESQQT